MGKHFNLNINLELSYDTPQEVISLFDKKMKGERWNDTDRNIIPFNFEIEYLFDSKKSIREQCLQTFHFQRQDYLQFPKFRELENNFFSFHLSRTIGDDGFYHGGYHLIVWLAKFSRTNGYIGEYHEPESNEINLLFTKYGEITVQRMNNQSMFKMSANDFDFEPPDIIKLKRIDDLEIAIQQSNWGFADLKIDELLNSDSNNLNYINIKSYISKKRSKTDNRVDGRTSGS